MQSGVSATERAFQIARSGAISNLDDIKRALRRECYRPMRSRGFQTAARRHQGRAPAREAASVIFAGENCKGLGSGSTSLIRLLPFLLYRADRRKLALHFYTGPRLAILIGAIKSRS